MEGQSSGSRSKGRKHHQYNPKHKERNFRRQEHFRRQREGREGLENPPPPPFVKRLNFDQWRLRRQSDLQNRPPPNQSLGESSHKRQKHLLGSTSVPRQAGQPPFVISSPNSIPIEPRKASKSSAHVKFKLNSKLSSPAPAHADWNQDGGKQLLDAESQARVICAGGNSVRENDSAVREIDSKNSSPPEVNTKSWTNDDDGKVVDDWSHPWDDPTWVQQIPLPTVSAFGIESPSSSDSSIGSAKSSKCDIILKSADDLFELPSSTSPEEKSTDRKFGRHGRVQSVKLLSEETSPSNHTTNGGGNGVRSLLNGTGQRATVSFIDIRSASKALRAGPSLSGQSLQIAYHEPGSVLPSQAITVSSVESNASPARSASGDVVSVNSEINVSSGNPPSTVPPLPTSVNPALGHLNNPSSPATTNGPGTNSSNNSYRQQRFPIQHGQSEDASSHFYEQPKGFTRGGRGEDHFHGGRGRRENRYLNNNRQGFNNPDRERRFRTSWYPNENRFAPPVHPESAENERTNSSVPPVTINNNEPGTNTSKALRIPDSPANSIPRHLPAKIHQSRSVSESGSSDGGSSVGSRSRSGSRSSVSSSASSARSRSPPHHGSSSGQVSSGGGGSTATGRFHQNSFSRQRYNRSRLVSRPADSSRTRHSHSSRTPPPMGGRSRSSSSESSPSPNRNVSTAPHSRSRSPSSTKSYSPSRSLNSSSSHHASHGNQSSKNLRAPTLLEAPLAIRIRNLPSRSSDTSLKDGLYHEYKKHGKLAWVRINGNGPERYAVVCFKSAEHASRAVSLSQDKLFFGCKIQVTPYQGLARGEEGLGGAEEDSRPFGEDEFATTTPSRTVFVTGLDPSITTADLRKSFEQYGDIVDAKVRKALTESGTCSGVIEFVDIASANRAQWVRHVFKAREARISFHRNPVSSSILLDGITGVTEKQITGHCCQFGAISRIVIDSERILALVQFEEISSAQTAFRELKNWIQKGRQLHVDFASTACVRLFLDRTLATNGNVLRLSPDLRGETAAASFLSALPGSATKSRRSGSRKIQTDRRVPYRNEALDDGRAVSDLSPESLSSRIVVSGQPNELNHVENCNGRRASRYNGNAAEEGGLGEEHEDRVLERRSSKVKHGAGSTKIDLSCHETDSAVVTSSSDIICGVETEGPEIENIPYENHLHKHIGGATALITVDGDEHGGNGYESVGILKSRASYRWNSKSQSVFDGVSSTSPEPKTETVQKVSPDSGIGNGSLVTVEPFPPATRIEAQVSPVLDPRRKPLENKIRRSSADSGNTHCSAFAVVNSNAAGSASSHSSETITPDKLGEDSDDRPSTPLCDENIEAYADDTSKSKMAGKRSPPPKSGDPPQFDPPNADYLQTRNPPRQNSKFQIPEADTRPTVFLAVESALGASPLIPSSSPPSVMPSSAAPVEEASSIGSPTDEKSLSSSCSSPPPPAKSTNTDNTTGTVPVSPLVRESAPLELKYPQSPPLRKRITPDSRKVSAEETNKKDEEEDKLSPEDDVSPPSSDCEGSPRGEEDLTQRLQELYQRFDAWDSGSRSVSRSLSYSSTGHAEDGSGGEPNRLSLHLDKPWLTRSKAIDLDELRQQPSDITKSLIAKRSVFDEDSQRLESLNDSNLNNTSLSTLDWRASFSARSSSTTSISSTTSAPPLTPMSASSSASSNSVFQLTPTLSGPTRPTLSATDTVSATHKSASLIPVKVPASSGPYLPTAGPLPNSIIKRKESVESRVGGAWGPSKDPRLASSKPQNSKIPSIVPVVLNSNSTVAPHGSTTHRSASLNSITVPKPSAIVGDLSKSKQFAEQSAEEHKPVLLTQKSAPPLGIHQGIPRMVERSMSLDSKKLVSSSAPPSTPLSPPATNPCNSIPASNSITHNRKGSVEPHSIKEGSPTLQRKDSDLSKDKKRSAEVKDVKEAAGQKAATPSLTIISSSGGGYSEPPKVGGKFEMSLSKDEERSSIPAVQCVVGAVAVATTQSQQSNVSSQSVSTKSSLYSNKEKEAKKEKSSKSGSSSSGSGKSVNNCRDDSSMSSNKAKHKKKEKSGEGPAVDKGKHEHENRSHHHHKDKKREGSVKEKSTANEIPNTPTAAAAVSTVPYEQKKDKEQLKKRRLSITETELDYKRPKLENEDEKEPATSVSQPENSHHRTKSVSSSGSLERRESRESSIVKKEVLQKEKSSSLKSSENKESSSPLPLPSKTEKSGGKSHRKDGCHHRSKSTSSSGSRNHYHGKPDKAPSSSSLHSQGLLLEKDKQGKGEKVGSSLGGRESKGSSQSKHSSSHSHNSAGLHHRKDKDEKDKDEKDGRPCSKSRREKGKNPFDSEEDEHSVGGTSKHKLPKSSAGKSEKRDSVGSGSGKSGKVRERQKSGGDSSSAACDSLKGENSSRAKTKEHKKRRSRVVEDTDSSTDDEERGKHHSIFDVVVDEYVSMYDKVKARSNRACKNVAPRKQEEELHKRQSKIQDSLQLLKKSRMKRDEKKRFAMDDRHSLQNSSDDEDSHSRHERDSSQETDRRRQKSPLTPRGSLSIITGLCSSSDESEQIDAAKDRLQHSKPKSKSSRDGSIKSDKSSSLKSSKKSSKASPLRSSAFFLNNHSDEDSGPSITKKRKISLKHKVPSLTVLSGGGGAEPIISSDDDSLSEPTMMTSKRPSLKNSDSRNSDSRKPSFPKIERKSLADIYTESDNSIQSSKDLKSISSVKPRKESKSSKQKSMRHIFETSDSSGDEKAAVVVPVKKEKELDVKVKPVLSFGKELKESKKKGSVHGSTSGSLGRSKSSSKKKRERLSSGDSKIVTSSGDGKRPQPTMEDLLFGPMSNSGSEFDEPLKPLPVPEETVHAPLTSLPVTKKPISSHDPNTFNKKSKSARSRNEQSRSSSSSLKSCDKSIDDLTASNHIGGENSRPKFEGQNAEKRKKKHHKKSKRVEGRDSRPFHRNEHPLDIDSLFSTPVASPVTKEQIQEHRSSVSEDIKPFIFGLDMPSSQSIISVQPICSSPAPPPPPRETEDEKMGRSMFSSDEDDDDKLKIDISEAIISASGGNEDEDEDLPVRIHAESHSGVGLNSAIEPIEQQIDEAAVAAANLLEEEEKNRNCLVEQDKAIESILMERKSPPRTPVGVLGSIGGLSQLQPQRDLDADYLTKDELKDEASISQEETEDAVAALLKNLGNDDDQEVEEAMEKRTASPPTIRIIEESPSPALSCSDQQPMSCESEMLSGNAWFTSPVKSPPKPSVEPETHRVEISSCFSAEPPSPANDDCASPPRKKKLTCEEASLQLHKVLEQAKQAVADSKKMEQEAVAEVNIKIEPQEKPCSTEAGTSGGDVYDFHDSDDETSRPVPAAPAITSTTISPVLTVPEVVQIKSEVIASTPPRTKSPASTGLLELVIEKLTLVTPSPTVSSTPQTQFSPKGARQTHPTIAMPTPLKPITIDVPPQPLESEPAAIFVNTAARSPLKVESPSKSLVAPPIQVVPTVPHIPLLTTTSKPPPAPVVSTVPRNSIDEIIEDVIRNFKCSESMPLPESPAIQSAGRKGKRRSGSKDSEELALPAKSRQTSPTRRLPANVQHSAIVQHPVVDHHGPNQPQQKQTKANTLPVIETRTDSHVPLGEAFLIDPQTGHLTHKPAGQQVEHSEPQFVPVSSEDLAKAHFVQHQTPLLSSQSHVQIQRGPQKAELERAGSLERIATEQQAYQIQIQKNEGLPAILAQQQQHHMLQQQQPVFDGNRRQSPSSAHTPPGGQQRKDSFSQSGAGPSPPVAVSSPSFNFGPLRAQSPPTSIQGRMHGMYSVPTSQPGYTPLMRPQQDPQCLRPLRQQLPMGQHVPSPGQIQAQLVRIPQVPMATTITKVDARNDEIQNRKSSITQPPSTVILTTTSNGPIGIMSGMRLPPAHHMQARAHEVYSSQGPPRIEIGSGMVQAAAGSPKGRAPQQHDPNQQQRLHQIPVSYDPPMDGSTSPAPLDLAPPPAHNHSRVNNNNNNPIAKNLARTNSNSVSSPSPPSQLHHGRQSDVMGRVIGRAPGGLEGQFMSTLSHQGNPYLPYNLPNVSQNQHPFGMRPGSVDPAKQQSDIPKLERPSTAHLVPQHLSSPHMSDRGSNESPNLVPMYGSRHPMYGSNGHLGMSQQPHHSPIPSAHQHQRQTFTHPFEFDESRMYARSPSYQIQMHHEREREAVPAGGANSPFAIVPPPLRRPEETPPPAHGIVRYAQHQVIPDPGAGRILQVEAPPHVAQAPPAQGDSLLMLLQRYPIVWQGMLALKNDSAACQFHFVSGNMNVATDSLPTNPDGTTLPLRISQRMRLETVQLDGVARKLQTEQEHCMLLALPCGRDHLDVLQHSNNLRSGFITYLQLKQAAGIVNVHQSSGDTPSFVIHIFPACEFANENLARIAPDLLQGVTDIAHLLIVIATV